MTNAELLAKIKAEIERRIKILREDEVVRQNCTSDFLEGKIYGYEESISLLSTLESEKPVPNDLAEATSKCKGCNNVKGCVTCVNGDQWAHYEESEKPMQEGLEEEIGKSIENLEGCTTKVGGASEYHLISDKDLREFARHFAQWGAEHLKEIEL